MDFVLSGMHKKPWAYIPSHDFSMVWENYQGFFEKKGARKQTVQKMSVGRRIFCALRWKLLMIFPGISGLRHRARAFFMGILLLGSGGAGRNWDKIHILSRMVAERAEGACLGGDVNAGTAQ